MRTKYGIEIIFDIRYIIAHTVVDTCRTTKYDNIEIEKKGKIRKFDFKPMSHIELGEKLNMLDLLKPIYQQTASYGHFGRSDIDLPCERTDKAEILKQKLVKE